jgi:GT2 family glycosyltransferase
VPLAVIVLNWNAGPETIRCVRRLSSWQRLPPTVWVVDNASTDGSADAIAGACQSARLIRNAANLGFAGGNNEALRRTLQESAPILLLNNDASIDELSAMRLCATLAECPELGFVGPLLLAPGEPPRLLSAGGLDIATHVNTHSSRLSPGPDVRIVDYVPGTAVVIRPEALAVGLFDESYFFSGEMADLCERARAKGIKTAIDTRARAIHTLGDLPNWRSALYTYYSLRNRFLFVRKFRPRQKVWLYGFWLLLGLIMGASAAVKGAPDRSRAISLALLDGLHGRYGGQNERVLRAIQRQS